jgi:hypothetical protein
MSDGSSDAMRIAERIRRYVHEHPGAADSATGIAAWWLQDSRGVSPAVEEALAKLVREGVLQREPLADGTIVYSAVRRPRRSQ